MEVTAEEGGLLGGDASTPGGRRRDGSRVSGGSSSVLAGNAFLYFLP